MTIPSDMQSRGEYNLDGVSKVRSRLFSAGTAFVFLFLQRVLLSVGRGGDAALGIASGDGAGAERGPEIDGLRDERALPGGILGLPELSLKGFR